MLEEFKKFALQGNVVDMAVGVVIGMAFGRIVNSLVDDILMPPLGLVLGKVDFSNLHINLSTETYETLQAAQAAGIPTINYGLFINAVVNFVIIALVLFLIVKQINRLRGVGEETDVAEAPAVRDCPFCLSSIPVEATRCPECTSDLAEV